MKINGIVVQTETERRDAFIRGGFFSVFLRKSKIKKPKKRPDGKVTKIPIKYCYLKVPNSARQN